MSHSLLSRVNNQSTLSAMDTLGTKIKLLRDQKGISQTALAESVGLSRSHMGQIESGKIALPNADIRRRLATALGVSHLDLLVAAGEITQAELGTVAGIVEQDPTDPRLELVALVKRIRLTEDRTDGLRALLRGWLERDMER